MRKTYATLPLQKNVEEPLERLREAYNQLHTVVEILAPEGRLRSLALTELEASAMWATKSLTHDTPPAP